MNFYKELSVVYDIVFPEDEDTTEFLSRGLKDGAEVLDLACGTGNYTIALGKKGLNTIGIDLDEAMIQIAKGKVKKENTDFYFGDMLSHSDLVNERNFDLIYCIGNSLVHLKDKETVEQFIRGMYKELNKEGQLILQIINYDRIIDKSIKSLPIIDRKEQGVKFIRDYRFPETREKIYFETKLIITKEDLEETYENSVPLLPIRSNELLKIIKEVGFSKIEMQGDFSGREFNEDSLALVIRAEK